MKLIIQGDRIVATATNDYAGPDAWVQAPEDFDAKRMDEYRVADGVAALPTSPVLDLQGTKDVLTARATSLRWQHETGGLTLPNGGRVATGVEDQNRITSVIANAELAGVAEVDFKAPSGWVTLTLAEIKAIAAAIALHVQACFSAERAHHEAIAMLADLAACDAYDVSAGWPV
ncbi:DUF4376 domain-containing protein [Melaminivora sp.]|uniref:DUF4376 domain-containing protein n=1 Tax=Melaminivora sp. TaxID=1933032 RepID=UPI0028AC4D27|nr:DUF4376 domain-containing protein [Melaminivora sp.]